MTESNTMQPTGPTSRIAFVGDSITASGDWDSWFPEVAAINLGVSGDTTDALLDRVEEIVSAHPDDICLLIGTNDLGKNLSVEHLVRNIELLLVELRQELPESRILVQSILPRGAQFADVLREANIHLRQFAPTVHAGFVDLWPALADERGAMRPEFSPDELHLSDAGYQAWLAELRPALNAER
jgi:lysophospholipase L1-like esterase